MCSFKKQAIAFGLLLLMALPLFLSVGIFVKQKIVQHQRRQRLEAELLQTIIIPSEKIVWIEPGKEVLADGKLFDVKSFKTDGVNVILTGFYDYKEDQLVKHMNDLIRKKHDSKSPVSKRSAKFLFFPQFKEVTTFSIERNCQIIKAQFDVYTEAVSTWIDQVPAPPPKNC